MFTGSGAGGGLAAGAPANQPIPITRLDSVGHVSALLSGPLSPRVSLVGAGTWAHGVSYRREQLATTADTNASVFAHLVFAPSATREWRLLAWVQHAESPFENWQACQDASASTSNTAVHLQSTLEQRSTDAARWRVFGGYTERRRTNEVGSSAAVSNGSPAARCRTPSIRPRTYRAAHLAWRPARALSRPDFAPHD